MRKIKALALLSGGLDSTLAIKVMLEQGIEVEAINFITPFCLCTPKGSCRYEARRVTDEFGIELKVISVAQEYIEMVRDPRYGYGKNMNPCIDCRIFMQKKAKEYMKEVDASFIITGDVLGQRPMSQRRDALAIIERDSGLKGLVLRPLSAKLLNPTIPEERGWIDRERLLKISGRSRKVQMELAKEHNIGDYPCPAGGCLLTDPGFAKRMKDLLKHCHPSLNDINLLKVGRHFRLSSGDKIVVGRDKEENERLLGLAKADDLVFKVVNFPGPITIARGNMCPGAIEKAAAITARYCKAKCLSKIEVSYEKLPEGEEKYLTIEPMKEKELALYRL